MIIKEKRPKSYDMQIGDKFLVFGEKPHTEGCCFKARIRGDKEETMNNFCTLSIATQALMSDNIQRIIRYANSNKETKSLYEFNKRTHNTHTLSLH